MYRPPRNPITPQATGSNAGVLELRTFDASCAAALDTYNQFCQLRNVDYDASGLAAYLIACQAAAVVAVATLTTFTSANFGVCKTINNMLTSLGYPQYATL